MTTLEIAVRVDARGLSCPMPIVKTAQAVKPLAPGGLVEVLATDPGSQRDFVAWSRATGHELVEQTVEGATYRFVIRRE
ncbi:MAG TPA: sulfurtransferase TusA family protein [Candidatus Limnocylindrales bacterium]|nr:sulfurtransferase TusA family protein [Candidatus Limnocylindrales bacterium]